MMPGYWYGDLSNQRKDANHSKICNCCDRGRVREQRPWPTPDNPDFRGAVCPYCDTAEAQ